MDRGVRDGHDSQARALPQILMLELGDGDIELLETVLDSPEHHALVLERLRVWNVDLDVKNSYAH
jgi:hypothetical protein